MTRREERKLLITLICIFGPVLLLAIYALGRTVLDLAQVNDFVCGVCG